MGFREKTMIKFGPKLNFDFTSHNIGFLLHFDFQPQFFEDDQFIDLYVSLFKALETWRLLFDNLCTMEEDKVDASAIPEDQVQNHLIGVSI